MVTILKSIPASFYSARKLFIIFFHSIVNELKSTSIQKQFKIINIEKYALKNINYFLIQEKRHFIIIA